MKVICALFFLILGAGLMAGAESKKQETKKTAASGHPLKLPKDAVQIENFMWRYKDPQGKIWIYRQTPFGLVRYEEAKEETAPARASKEAENLIQATEDGDTIRFERPGPFGNWRWTKKKSEELTQEERVAWERARTTSKAKE
jgi:hypothetical protein